MKKTLFIMRHEIATSLRRKTFVLFAFGLPLALGLVAVAVFLINQRPERSLDLTAAANAAAVVDQGQVGLVDQGDLVAVWPDDPLMDRFQAFPDEDSADAALAAGEIEGYYLIPPDYVQNGEVTYVTSQFNPLGGDHGKGGLSLLLLVNLLEGDADLAAAVWHPLRVDARPLAAGEAVDVEESWIVELFPTLMVLILYMVILVPAGMLVNAVTDEKKNRVMEVLVASVSTTQMISGKILALGVLGLISAALWLGILAGVISFGGRALQVPEGYGISADLLAWSLVYIVLGYAMYGAQLAGVGALAPDAKDSRSANLAVMAPLIVAYLLNTVIITDPNGLIAVVLSLFPLTSPVAMIARMTVTSVPLWQSALAALLGFVMVIGIVRLVARLFRAQMLLSGQSFSAGRYYRALLGKA